MQAYFCAKLMEAIVYIAKITVTSAVVINVPTKELLAAETKRKLVKH